MWTDTTRAQYARADLALPTDLTDAEWAVLEPFFPPPSQVGCPRKWPLRRIIEAILYLLRGGFREAAAKVFNENSKGWKNKKHRDQWLNSLEAYGRTTSASCCWAGPIIRSSPSPWCW